MDKIIKDIREIVGANVRLAFEIDITTLIIWLEFDEYATEDIPIEYNTVDKCAYISFERWHKTHGYPEELNLNEIQYGLVSTELKTICRICDYIESNTNLINDILDKLSRRDD